METRKYRGVHIHRNTEPHKLRWWALMDAECGGRMLAADTLEGMKHLIRHYQGVYR